MELKAGLPYEEMLPVTTMKDACVNVTVTSLTTTSNDALCVKTKISSVTAKSSSTKVMKELVRSTMSHDTWVVSVSGFSLQTDVNRYENTKPHHSLTE